MAGRGAAGRGPGGYDVSGWFDGGPGPGFENPRAWGSRNGGYSKPDILCYQCSKPGHTKLNCPNVRCHGCKQLGHFFRDCPSGLPVGRFQAERGALLRDEREFQVRSRDFAYPPAFEGPPDRWHKPDGTERFDEPRGGAKGAGCYTCGQPGHFARECPNLPPPKKASASPRRPRGGWFYEDLDGRMRGPHDLEQLHEWLRRGQFTLEQRVVLDGTREIVPLSRALGLRDYPPGPQQILPPRGSPLHRRPAPFAPHLVPRPANPPVQLPRLQIPDVPPPQPARTPLTRGTPPLSTTPPFGATPSMVSSISPNLTSSVSPRPQGFAFPTPPPEPPPPLPPPSPPTKTEPPPRPLLVAEHHSASPQANGDEKDKHVHWENGYDGTSDLSDGEPGSPLHVRPTPVESEQQKGGEPEAACTSISARVEKILRDAEVNDASSAEERMDTVIGILGRRLTLRESKEAREMKSFVHGSQTEVELEVATVSAWRPGYGFGEMSAAEAREASAGPSNEYNLNPDLFFHAYGPGNTGKGGQAFYHDEEAAWGEPETDAAGEYELHKERENQDPAKWLLRGGDWKLENDPQLRLEPDDSGNPPPPCKYVLNRGVPLCKEESPDLASGGKERPRDPRMVGPHRAAMQEAVKASFSRLEVPLFGRGGIPASLQKARSRPVTDSPKPMIRSPTDNVRPPVKKVLKKTGVVGNKPGVLKKAVSTSDVVKAADSPANGLFRNSPKPASLTPKGSPAEAPKKARVSKWDEQGEKKTSLAEAVQAAKRAHLGPEDGQWYYLDGQGIPQGPYALAQLRIMAAQGKIMEGISAWRTGDDTWVPITRPKETRFGPPLNVLSPPPMQWPRPPNAQWLPPWGVPAPVRLQPPLPPGLPPGARMGGPRSRWEDPPARLGEERGMPPQLLAMVRGKLHEQVVKTARTKVVDAAIDSALSAWLQEKLGTSEEYKEPEKQAGGEESEPAREGGVEVGPSADIPAPPPVDDATTKLLERLLKRYKLLAYLFLGAFKSSRGGTDMALLARTACVCRGFRMGVETAKGRIVRADFSGLGERCTDAALKSLETSGASLLRLVYLNGCVNVTPEAVEDLLRAQSGVRCVDIQGCVQLYSFARGSSHIKWRNLPEALVEIPGGTNALSAEQLEDQQKRREKFAKARQLRGIERILDEIRKLDGAKIFLVPVSEEQYPNYSKVIQRPIALVTMRQRLKGRYLPLVKGVDRFGEDMALMFDNAKRFNREGSFYYKEAVRLQKVADKLLDALKTRVKGTLDGTVPVRKASLQRSSQKTSESDLALQTRLPKPSRPPRGLGEVEALPSISTSSVEESYRTAGIEEEMGRKRKERDEREELESSKRRREDSDAESKGLRMKRPREEDKLELESARRPVSAPLLQWEQDQKRKRTKRPESRGNMPQEFKWAGIDFEAPARRAAAKRFAVLDETELWPSSESEDEEPQSEAESIENASESEEEEDDLMEDEEAEDHTAWVMEDDLADRTHWGAKMTKATMVPPVSRKYELIDEYRIVSDKEMVERKMDALLPDLALSGLTLREGSVSHLDAPVVHAKKARKKLGEEVLEQEVYGIDPYTHNLLLDTMPKNVKGFMTDDEKRDFIEQPLLKALNRAASAYTGYAKVPESLDLKVVVQIVHKEAEEEGEKLRATFAQALSANMEKRTLDKYLAYRKGLGVVCNKTVGIPKEDFVVEFHGEVYPPYRWFEKEDEIRRLQKKEVAPEFYNIMLERPKMDLGGYDLLVVDAMHKANFASRLCHSCTPNCQTKVTAVNGRYMIGVYAMADIKQGEELTFNYHSVTESKEEHEHAVCLCGSRACQGSYLNFAGSTSFQQVMNKIHGVLDRHHLLLTACEDPTLSVDDRAALERAGFKSSLLDGLPPWVVKYAAQVAHFVFRERELLPQELLDHNKKHKRRTEKDKELAKQLAHAAQDEAEGVESQRLQNLAITLDKVRHCLTALCRCPATEVPPLLRRLSSAEVVNRLWTAEESIVQQIRRFLELHVDDLGRLEPILAELDRRRPEETDEGLTAMRASLLWIRDTLIGLDIKPTARHDAAADLLSMYAATKDFFTHADYVQASFESEPVTIVAMDLGVKESTFPPKTVRKSYKPYFVWGQLINWYKQSVADPGATLNNVRRGCLTLPDPGSCYSATAKQAIPRGYGRKQRARMLDKYIANKVQGPWPKQEQHWLWSHNIRGLYGTPWFDAVREGRPVDPDLLRWLRTRPVFEGPYDHGR